MNGNALTIQYAWPKNLRFLQAGEVQGNDNNDFKNELAI